MSDRAENRRRRRIRLPAALAAGLAAGLAGAWLLPVPFKSAPEALPQTAPTGAPTATQAVPAPASDAAQASLADILRQASPFQRSLALYRLAAGLDVAGVERLLDEARALDQLRAHRAVSILYGRYAELDPAAALRHAQRQGDDAYRWLGAVFHALARIDLDAALAHAETLDPRQRDSAAAAILQARDDLPPETQAEIAANLAPQSGLQEWAALQNPQARLRHAWRQALKRKTGDELWHDVSHTVGHWAATEPLAALDAIRSADELAPHWRASLRSYAVRVWATVDPAAAMGWAMALPASASRNELIGDALHGWAENDPRAAAAWLLERGMPAISEGALRMAEAFAVRHPEDAVDWALALPSEQAVTITESVFGALSEADPTSAAGLLGRIGDANVRRAAENALMHGWANTDPDGALAWLDWLHDVDRREALAATLLEAWADYDVASAARHVDRLADPGTRDDILLSLLEKALEFDAELALRLFRRIEHEERRSEAAQKIYRHLSKTHPALVERYR